MKFRNNNYKIRKIKKDKIRIVYSLGTIKIGCNLVTESNDYETWYEFEKNEHNSIIIKSLNIRIGKVIYYNVDEIYINGYKNYGVYEGFCKIERID